MILRLERLELVPAYTMGRLYVDDELECWVLEDPVRAGPKVDGDTAIPAGTYEVAITFSNRFHRPLPLLKDVPGFEGIRIHPGNTTHDTRGCLLVGMERVGATVRRSRPAFEALFQKIKLAREAGDHVAIEIVGPGAST